MPRAGALSKVLHEELTFFLDFPGIQAYSVCVGSVFHSVPSKGVNGLLLSYIIWGRMLPVSFKY